MKTVKTPNIPVCPVCGEEMGEVTGVWHDNPPDPGDLAVCIYCAAVLVIEEGMTARPITTEEEEGLDNTERAELDAAQGLARMLIEGTK